MFYILLFVIMLLFTIGLSLSIVLIKNKTIAVLAATLICFLFAIFMISSSAYINKQKNIAKSECEKINMQFKDRYDESAFYCIKTTVKIIDGETYSKTEEKRVEYKWLQ